jgi:hypothetical protein
MPSPRITIITDFRFFLPSTPLDATLVAGANDHEIPVNAIAQPYSLVNEMVSVVSQDLEVLQHRDSAGRGEVFSRATTRAMARASRDRTCPSIGASSPGDSGWVGLP